MDKIVFETSSSEIYRNFDYDDNDRSPVVEYGLVERSGWDLAQKPVSISFSFIFIWFLPTFGVNAT